MDNYLMWIVLIITTITLITSVIFYKKLKTDKSKDYSTELIKIGTLLERLDSVVRQEMSTVRTEQSKRMTEFEQSLITKLSQMTNTQLEQLSNITKWNNEVISKMSETVDKKLDAVKLAVENKLKEIQNDNSEKIEKMRLTVDEKLHKTLEERLGQSFKLVSDRLEQVHKGLGEMQNLAVGVGDLKKVLSNVKTRGIMGEIQLENILEQILSADQYEKNAATNPNTHDVVEFAIKLPGKEMDGSIVYLPIDSKFPIEAYYLLLEAYEKANADDLEQAAKAIESAIKKSAKDIRDKYIYPPATTDFAVMFLPIEGLYAEVVRRPQLLETLQREYKIVVTGPTTFAALLNSLQIGFRTLAIEKRSSEVWKILSAVKTEFNKFGDVLEKAQKKISDAGTEIEKLVGARSKKIIKQLNQVSELKQSEASEILLIEGPDDVLDDEIA